MIGVERLLRQMLQGRGRRWTCIILSCAVLLVLGLPAADEYTAQHRKQRELGAALKQTSEQVQQREHWKQQADAAHATLATFEQRAFVETEVNNYRSELVQQIRNSGCQLRRLNIAQAAVRPWREDSHPLKPDTRGPKADEDANLQLRSQTVSLSVSGSLESVQSLLGKMHQRGTLKHTSELSIRPTGTDRKDVVLEMEFILYGLEKATKSPVA